MAYSLVFLSPKILVSSFELISIESQANILRKPRHIDPSILLGPENANHFHTAASSKNCSLSDIKIMQLFETGNMLLALPIKICKSCDDMPNTKPSSSQNASFNAKHSDLNKTYKGESMPFVSELRNHYHRKQNRVPVQKVTENKPKNLAEKIKLLDPLVPVKKDKKSSKKEESLTTREDPLLVKPWEFDKAHYKTRPCLNMYNKGFKKMCVFF